MIKLNNTGDRRGFINKLSAIMALSFLGSIRTDAQRSVTDTQFRTQGNPSGAKSLKDYKLLMRTDGQKAKNTLNELVALVDKMPESQELFLENRLQYEQNFENFDQKATQLQSLISNVMKSMHDMQSAVIRNLK